VVNITSGRLVLCPPLRGLKLSVGDYVIFEEDNGKLVLSKVVLKKDVTFLT
jgi:hypothetical protein